MNTELLRRQVRGVCLFLFLFIMGTAHLNAQTLSIGQIPFRLGMTMKEATAMIHDPIYLDDGGKTGVTGTWYVREKHGENNFVLIGSIIFRNGRAETLARDLKSLPGSDAKEVGNALFQALERLKRDDPTVSINTRSWFISSESGEIKEITIGAGLRRVQILVPETRTAEITISEVLTLAKRHAEHPK